MDDFIRSIKAHLYDRVSSPLFGIFAISWVAWNYKFVIVVFSGSMKTIEKFDYISNVLYAAPEKYLFYGLILPAVTTIAFIYIYPWLAKKVFIKKINEEKLLYDIKQEVDNKKLLTLEDSIRIKKEAMRIEGDYNNEISRLKEERERNNKTIEELLSKKNEVTEHYNKLVETNNNLNKKVAAANDTHENMKIEIGKLEKNINSLNKSLADMEKKYEKEKQANNYLTSEIFLQDSNEFPNDISYLENSILSTISTKEKFRRNDVKVLVMENMEVSEQKYNEALNILISNDYVKHDNTGKFIWITPDGLGYLSKIKEHLKKRF